MVVKTRSYQKQQHVKHYEEDVASVNENIEDTDIHITASNGCKSGSRRSRVTIVTPSFLEASTRTYKVYSPRNKPENINNNKKKGTTRRQNKSSASASEEVLDAAETLASLLEYDDSADSADMSVFETPSSHNEHDTQSNANKKARVHKCINPTSPISKYIYRIGIYNISLKQHYKTSYILYDPKSRMFYVYTIISNQVSNEEETAYDTEPSVGSAINMEFSFPQPKNPIQTIYTTYINENVSNYVMTMVIPSSEHDYYIQDDIIGAVISNDEFREKAFSEDSSFYDIEDIIFDDTSSETTNGYKAFMLIPSRYFWFSPVGLNCAVTDANTIAYHDHKYTRDTVDTVLMIVSQST